MGGGGGKEGDGRREMSQKKKRNIAEDCLTACWEAWAKRLRGLLVTATPHTGQPRAFSFTPVQSLAHQERAWSPGHKSLLQHLK